MEETSSLMKVNSTNYTKYKAADEIISKSTAILGLLVGTLSSCVFCYVYVGRKLDENRTDSTKKRRITWQKLFSSLNMFSGGIFFGMSLLFLLPESSSDLDSYFKSMNKNYTYPFCEMLVSAGFFLVLFLERSVTILYKVWEKRSKSSDEQSNLQDGIKSPISSSSTLSSPSSPSSSPPQHQHQQPLSHQPLSSPSLPTTLATTSEVIELTTIASRNDKSENKATSEIHSSESSSRNICLHIVDEEVLPSDSKYRNTADFGCLISSRKTYKSEKTFKENQTNLAESSDELCILIPDQCVCSIENHLVDSQNGRFVCQDISNKEKLFCRSHSSIGIYGSTVTDQTNIPLHFANDNSCYHNDEYHSAQNHEERTVKYISNVQTAEENTPVEETEENDDLHQSGAIILLLVLIFHSFFDGITLGLRKEVMDIFTIMFALIFHKCLIAFSLTLKLRETFTDRLWRVKLWLVIFSFISPIGATIGWLLSYNEMDPMVFHKGLSGTLTSISTGTLFYVTFFEILGPDLINHKGNFLQVLSVMIGFGVMASLKIL
ncbi:protein zntD-like [Octopus sinensis]|uniref:Protein zntD-like n=1 Tax=Octopus sinensis TaxID=2607531 RepID=A0A6P7T8K1_9MOLL|nr:protein zntD-like [Octopus sinensis]